jgi:hypothetical protein
MTQRPSRCCSSSTVSRISSSRKPQPESEEGAIAFAFAGCWIRQGQKPARLLPGQPVPRSGPSERAPGILAIPAASSGASRPLSAASAASLRIAASWTLIAEADNPRVSRVARSRCQLPRIRPT